MVGELRARQIRFLHQLFSEIARNCREEYNMSESRLSEYRDGSVSPTDFKATKPEHERALMELADAVGEWAREEMDAHPEPEEPAPAPPAQ